MPIQHIWTDRNQDGKKREVRATKFGGAWRFQAKMAGDLDWTVLAPGNEFTAGERTGKFRLGSHELIIDENGKSAISFEDYAIALLDEIETPHHLKDIFSIGY